MGQIGARDIEDLNKLAAYLAKRDVDDLTGAELKRKQRCGQADLLIVLGSSLPFLAERAAQAVRQGVAKRLMIAGGIGHSTSYLNASLRANPRYADLLSGSFRTEAELLREVAVRAQGLERADILLETQSTNCGSNASYAFEVLKEQDMLPETVILMQDPAMQLRTHVSFQQVWKERSAACRFISFAAFIPRCSLSANGELQLEAEGAAGPLWAPDRYLPLVMGEIPRLRDDEEGYGPNGKGFIGHVDIPEPVEAAFRRLSGTLEGYIRSAAP